MGEKGEDNESEEDDEEDEDEHDHDVEHDQDQDHEELPSFDPAVESKRDNSDGFL